MENKISVIIPVYNAEKFLDSCLDSISNQTYKNLQIILVDDGSKDSSGEICDSYAANDVRFEVYHQENLGQAAARNLGLAHAKGDWIGFADNDDIIEQNMYEILLKNALENSVLISGCATNTVYKNGSRQNKFCDIKSGIKDGDIVSLDILYQTQHAWGAVWNKIYHVSLAEKLKFPEGFQLEDYWVSIRLYHEVKRIYFDNRPLYNWYQRSTSQSHKLFGKEKITIFEMAERIKEYCIATKDEQLIMGGHYFSFISYVSLIDSICKYGDAKSRSVAKQNIKVAKENLNYLKLNNPLIKKLFLIKKIVKLVYSGLRLRSVI